MKVFIINSAVNVNDHLTGCGTGGPIIRRKVLKLEKPVVDDNISCVAATKCSQ